MSPPLSPSECIQDPLLSPCLSLSPSSLRELTFLTPVPPQFTSGLLRNWMYFTCSLSPQLIIIHNKKLNTQLVKSVSEPFNHNFCCDLYSWPPTSLLLIPFLPSLNCSSVSHNFYTTFLKIFPKAKDEGESYKKQFPRRLQQHGKEEVICSSSSFTSFAQDRSSGKKERKVKEEKEKVNEVMKGSEKGDLGTR